jgi:hypothetical protein
MKKIIQIFGIAIVLLFISTSSFAQGGTTNFDMAAASATIVAPITLEKWIDLEFGDVAVSAVNDGTLELLPNGNNPADRNPANGVTVPVVQTSGDPLAAKFTASGIVDYTYSITLPTTDIILTRVSGSEVMEVNAFTSTPSGTGQLDHLTGTQDIYVGATLNVTAGEVPGHYVTDANGFTVTVNYN